MVTASTPPDLTTTASTDHAGVYVGPLPAGVPAGLCTLSVAYGAFDTAGDTDSLPEMRSPGKIELTLIPNLAGPVTLPDGTVMLVSSTKLTSTDGTLSFWCIDLARAAVNPPGANWTASLKVDGVQVAKFTFSPDSTTQVAHNLGEDLPVLAPVTGTPVTRGVGVSSISTVDGQLVFTMTDGSEHVVDFPAGTGGGGTGGGGTTNPTNPATNTPAPFVVSTAVDDAILADTPALYLPMQEATGDTPTDHSGHGVTVTPTATHWRHNDGWAPPLSKAPSGMGRYWWNDGIPGNDEVNIAVTNPSTVLAGMGSAGFSAEVMLCRTTAAYGERIFTVSDGAGDLVVPTFGNDDTTLTLNGPSGSITATAAASTLNVWHHYAFTITAAGAATILVDGQVVATGSIGAMRNGTSLWINSANGTGSYANTVDGGWSRFALYNKALTTAQMQAHYAALTAPTTMKAFKGTPPLTGGVNTYYSGFTQPATPQLTKNSFFPVIEWWPIAPTTDQVQAETAFVNGGAETNSDTTVSMWQAKGAVFIRDTERQPVDPSTVADAWVVEDEPDMKASSPTDYSAVTASMQKIPSGALTYTNFGTALTRDQDRVIASGWVNGQGTKIVSADAYFYCVTPAMTSQFAGYWNIPANLVRRAVNHATVVKRVRAVTNSPRPVYAVVAAGHANGVGASDTGWGSVPTADEVRGSIWASIIGGADGIVVFTQSYQDAKTAPTWSAATQYAAGDTVTTGGGQFFYARSVPTKGTTPASDTAWVAWQVGPSGGLRNAGIYAPGVPAAVAQAKTDLQALASVLHSDRVAYEWSEQLVSRTHWDGGDGFGYALVMQSLGNDAGTYTITVPDGVNSISVYDVSAKTDTPLTVTNGTAQVTFTAECETKCLRWALGVTSTAA